VKSTGASPDRIACRETAQPAHRPVFWIEFPVSVTLTGLAQTMASVITGSSVRAQPPTAL